jgi:hypothetical protein
MKEYFELQYKMTIRRFRDAGIEPIFAYIILPVGFYGLSAFLFNKSDFAEYIYLFIALNVMTILSETRRTEFLNICFGDVQFKKIRITENLILSIPFISFLIYKQLFIYTLLLLLISIVLALVNFRTKFNYTIFSPFSGRPFEFTTGFRNTFPLFFIAYIIVFIAATVNNFNLGVFSLIIVFATSVGFYLNPENEYFVWIYGMNPKKFLFSKMKTAILFSSTLVLPIVILLSVIFPQNIGFLFLFISFGWAFLVCTIVTKYSSYPNEINIPKGLLLGLCVGLPPMLVILIPSMFLKAENRLKKLLK